MGLIPITPAKQQLCEISICDSAQKVLADALFAGQQGHERASERFLNFSEKSRKKTNWIDSREKQGIYFLEFVT